MKPEGKSPATSNSMTKINYNKNSDIEIENISDVSVDDMGRRPYTTWVFQRGFAGPASAILDMDIKEFKSILRHGY